MNKAGQEVSNETIKVLAEIKSTSKVTQDTTTGITKMLIEEVVALLREKTASTVVSEVDAEAVILEKSLTELVDKHANTLDGTAKDRLEKALQREVSSAFRAIKYKTTSIDRSEIDASVPGHAATLPPGVVNVIQWVADDGSELRFIGVKYLRDTIFRSDPAAQEAIQYCIDDGMLSVYLADNPKNQDWKTQACRLNLSHPRTKEILDRIQE